MTSSEGIVVLAGIRDGQKKRGVDKAPHDLVKFIDQNNWTIIAGPTASQEDDTADSLPIPEFSSEAIHRPKAVGNATKILHDEILKGGLNFIETQKKFPKVLTLGGDHSLAIGSISGVSNLCASAHASNLKSPFSDPNIVVVWVDAHADLNPPKFTVSGNLHGCPMSLLLDLDREGWQRLQHFQWAYDNLKKFANRDKYICHTRLMYIGARDVDDAETELLNQYGIVTYTMERFKQEGRNVEKIITENLAKLDPEGKYAIHLSFDIDGIDPTLAPTTGTPVPDGLTREEGVEIVRQLRNTGRLVSMDLAEVNPSLEKNEGEAELTLKASQLLLDVFTGKN